MSRPKASVHFVLHCHRSLQTPAYPRMAHQNTAVAARQAKVLFTYLPSEKLVMVHDHIKYTSTQVIATRGGNINKKLQM